MKLHTLRYAGGGKAQHREETAKVAVQLKCALHTKLIRVIDLNASIICRVPSETFQRSVNQEKKNIPYNHKKMRHTTSTHVLRKLWKHYNHPE